MKLKTFYAVLTALVLLVGGPRAEAQYPQMPGAYPGAYYPQPPMGAMPGPYGVAPATLTSPAGIDATQAAYGGGDLGGCADCGKDTCGGKGCGNCCECGWCHRVAVFGEFLYLRARDSEVAYAVPVDGPIVPPVNSPPIQVGRVGVVDQDFDPGFRLGFTYVMDPRSSITAQYSLFETSRIDQSATAAPFVLRSLVSHPSSITAGTDWLNGQATHSLDWDLIDVDYRNIIDCCDLYKVNWLAGVRYAHLNQNFHSLFAGNGTENVDTNIDFDGVGLRAGLEGERYTPSKRLMVYGKLHGSLLAGEFRADYQQQMSFDPTVVDTSWKAGRIVPIVDLEVGGGWQSKCGTWRMTAGYIFSGWFNTVKTDEWIDAVRRSNFVGMGDTMTFDGLVARVEGRF